MENTLLSQSGKMYPEHSAATEEKISESCWSNWHESKKLMLQSLDLRKTNGQKQESSAVMDTALRGELLMLNIGESPNAAVESRLLWILQDSVPERYYLSLKACQGILNRAYRRGKKLPEILETALRNRIAKP